MLPAGNAGLAGVRIFDSPRECNSVNQASGWPAKWIGESVRTPHPPRPRGAMGGAGPVDLLGRWRRIRDLPRLENLEFRPDRIPPARATHVAQVAQAAQVKQVTRSSRPASLSPNPASLEKVLRHNPRWA